MNPSSERWRPRRAGIINLYEYSNQVFDFAGGRLLLRGHNTSGKTKALELLLPFCLDGDISPNKLDPFGAAYKDMRWNVVGCTDQEKRTGYVWLEFERLNPTTGAPRRLTVGIGMRAHRQIGDVTRWHFMAHNRTVGEDLQLLRGRDPISKPELVAAIGDDGEVLDGQRDYRARLNDLLFGFGGGEHYQTMLRLMRDLRKPHLSKTLDPDRVAEQLTVGLPEVDENLMRRLAGGLEQLETLERGLARLRDVRDRVRRFHQRTYNAYARAVVRERADALRQAQTAVENAAEQLRATRTDLAAARERAASATTQRETAETDLARLTAEEHAIVSSAAWSSVAEVEALREHAVAQARAATAAREHADAAAATAGALEAELITARAAADDRRQQATADLGMAVELAGQAGLAKRVEHTAAQLRAGTLRADTWSQLLRELVADWRDVLHRHRELLRSARRAAASAEQARADERDAAARLEQLSARREACEQELEQARAALAAAFARWRARLVELRPDDDAVSAALELASAGQPGGSALAACVERSRTQLADERAGHLTGRRAAAADVTRIETEIERLAAAHDDGPPPPGWPREARAQRPGAPLWRLVDFRDNVPAHQRAGLEAAFEAAGLLDAWVTPSGHLDDPALADVVLAGSEPVAGASALEALAPVADQGVAADIVAGLLGCIGLGSRDAGPWVDFDGRFALGPLAGRGAKDRAEHIGAAARETRRAARIAELHARIAALEAEIAAHDQAIGELDRRRATADAELEQLPACDEVAAAVNAVRIATALQAEAARNHEQAASAARAAAEAEIAADAAQREHAASHNLPAPLDEPVLDGLRDAAAELSAAAATVARAWTHADREARAANMTAARLAEAQEQALEQDRRARDERVEADRLTAEHAARANALGASGDDLRRRHEEVVTGLKTGRETERHAAEAAREALVAVAGLEKDETARATEHEAVRAAREQAGETFAQLAMAGVLQLVLGDAAPPDADVAAGWTFTRALEVARALPEELLSVRSASGELAVEVQRGVQLLDRELAEADMSAYAIRGADGLLLVRVAEAGAEQTLGEMLVALAAEIADREQILSAEERRVFNDALVEEIADHLRHRIHDVRGRVASMNAVLARSPTAAGKRVELEWQPIDDDAGTQRAALALLRREVRHLEEGSRAELVAFFRGRIDAARREHAVDGQPRPMAETLRGAFDYRRWFAFGLYEHSAAGRVRLTRRRHAVGSGGEQSVLIHLPLFAAAAAMYGDGQGPRLIMLDEALSGIDDETRERVLEATVAFDLDIVMTSHELWGTYRSVPQLSIYQLHRENGTFGVHAIPFIWDGDVLRELEQDELLV